MCDYVSIVKGPSVSHKTAKIKLQFVSVFRNALKKSIRLPLYNKIHSAHVGGPKKKKKKSQRKKRNLLLVYLQEDSFLASFSSTNGIKKKKAGRKPMIYLKGPGVFCPVA